jgi:hypothetical protein
MEHFCSGIGALYERANIEKSVQKDEGGLHISNWLYFFPVGINNVTQDTIAMRLG